MKTLMTPEQVVALAFPEGSYLPPDAIAAADIAAVESRALRPVTGDALYEALLAGEYPTLCEEYVQPALAYAVRLAVQPALDLCTGSAGTVAPNPSWGDPAGTKQLLAARRSLRNRALSLMQRLSDHLASHPAHYPEYRAADDVLQRAMLAGGVVLRR